MQHVWQHEIFVDFRQLTSILSCTAILGFLERILKQFRRPEISLEKLVEILSSKFSPKKTGMGAQIFVVTRPLTSSPLFIPRFKLSRIELVKMNREDSEPHFQWRKLV